MRVDGTARRQGTKGMVECTNTRGVYTSPRIYSFNRGHAEREQVTQQVAVFTGFPGDETRAVGPVVESHATSTSTAAKPPPPPPPPLPFSLPPPSPPSLPPSRPRRAVPMPPLNGHKASVRNLRVEALTAWRRRRRRRQPPSLRLRHGLR